MKKSILISGAITLFLIASITIADTKDNQKAEWKGKIDIENGIKLIKNPREPLYGEIELELEEDLSIGNEQDENYMFIRVSDIEVDEKGNIYVLDSKECRIQKYDKDGNYLQTIGRKGQGPGEFERAFRMVLDSKGRIYVNEFRKIHIFGENGEFKRSRNIGSSISSYRITKDGNILGHSRTSSEEGRTLDIVLIDSEGKKLKTIASFTDQSGFMRKGNISIGMSLPFGARLYFCPLSEELGIYGYSSEYKLFVINSSGEITHIIEKDEPRQAVTQKEKRKIIKDRVERQRGSLKLSEGDIKKLLNFPKYKAFYTQIITDDKSRIYVRKMKPVSSNDKIRSYDLFSQEGYYLYKLKIYDIFPSIIKNGFIYTSKSDPDTGYYKIIRYRIINWDKIKEGI